MHIEKKTIRNLFFGAVGCVIVYWLLHDTERAKLLWSALSAMFAPFATGAAVAFILNVPLRGIERLLKFIQKDGLRRVVAIILTFVVICLVITGVIKLLIPQITETIQALVPKLVSFVQRIMERLLEFLQEHPEIREWLARTFNTNFDLESFDWAGLAQNLLNMFTSSVSAIATSAVSVVGSLTGGIVDAVIAIVFSLYCLSRKEILARQGRRILYSLLPEHFADETIRVMRLTNATFSNFISGQCLEACILGCLFAVAMALFKMPYIPLVSVLIAVTALIPVVGAFVGCILGAFFILVNDPLQAVIFVAMFLVLQQIEGNLIYPKVVGTSIGLPGMWVLVAVAVGGDLMGVMGMFVMIPIAAVLYTLMREFTAKRVTERNIDREKLKDHPPELKSKFKEHRERRKRQRLAAQMKELKERAEAAAANTLHKKDK